MNKLMCAATSCSTDIIRKNNDLIQKSRFSLTTQQQKVVLYLISQIKPYDDDFKLYRFSIKDFCEICHIDPKSGKNYSDLKNAIKRIADKSIWIKQTDTGKQTLVRWIEKPFIDDNSGVIELRLDADLKPYLLHLTDNYTEYEWIWIAQFESKYSIRLYEFLQSINDAQCGYYERTLELSELRRVLDAENYTIFADLYRRVLVPATTEVTKYSDKEVRMERVYTGRRVTGITFKVRSKENMGRLNGIHTTEAVFNAERPEADTIS